MGNCCCVPSSSSSSSLSSSKRKKRKKKNFREHQKKTATTTTTTKKKRYYKTPRRSGALGGREGEEYDDDDDEEEDDNVDGDDASRRRRREETAVDEEEEEEETDYDRHSSVSHLNKSSLYDKNKNKVLLNNHAQLIAQKQLQLQQKQQQQHHHPTTTTTTTTASSTISSTTTKSSQQHKNNNNNLLYLQQSHLTGNNINNNNKQQQSKQKHNQLLLLHQHQSSDDSGHHSSVDSRITTSLNESSKLLIPKDESKEAKKGSPKQIDQKNNKNKNKQMKRPLNSIDVNLELNNSKLSRISSKNSSSSSSTSSSSSISISSSSLLESTSNSIHAKAKKPHQTQQQQQQQQENKTTTTTVRQLVLKLEPQNDINSKRLAYRKRSNHLNQSLNETDLSVNNNKSALSSQHKHNSHRRRPKQHVVVDKKNSNNNNNEEKEEEVEDEEEEAYNSDDINNNSNNTINNKSSSIVNSNYRSLQKSKRSIKTLEKGVKNSKSIEKWLNEYGKLKEVEPSVPEESQASKTSSDSVASSSFPNQNNHNHQNNNNNNNNKQIKQKQNKHASPRFVPNEALYRLVASPLATSTSSSSSSSSKSKSKSSEETKTLMSELPVKLSHKLEILMGLNATESIRNLEADMFNFVKEFILPKSLANLEDITYLKWLLNENNFNVFAQQPILDTHITYILSTNNNLEIEVEEDECGGEVGGEETNEEKFTSFLVYSVRKQSLSIQSNKIKKMLEKEKELTNATTLHNREILDSFRTKYLESGNFVGAHCLMNMCQKQQQQNLDIKKKQHQQMNSSTTSSSSTSSPSDSFAAAADSSSQAKSLIPVNCDDLNDKLFLCFLSNFSCKLVENFLLQTANNNNNNNNANLNQQQSTTSSELTTTGNAGFVRKHKLDHTFSYVNNFKNSSNNLFNSSKIKFMFRLNKWPKEYDFAKRNRSVSQTLIEYIMENACLVSHSCSSRNRGEDDQGVVDDDDDEFDNRDLNMISNKNTTTTTTNKSVTSSSSSSSSSKWQIDTSLAETILFKSFSRTRLFLFHLSYIVFNNLKLILDLPTNTTKTSTVLIRLDKRTLLHHMLKYLDSLNASSQQVLDTITTYQHLSRFLLNFTIYLRLNVLNKYQTLNRPNYFNTNLPINPIYNENVSFSSINELLLKCEEYFKKGARLYELNLDIENLATSSSTASSSSSSSSANDRAFNEYLVAFYKVLFDKFKSKRDNFKINEATLNEIHAAVSRDNQHNVDSLPIGGVDLLTKFEIYAECVHKYLPQIRQQNQFLLFHYIWTMQVQYLAPFLNYICDLYKAYD